MNKKLITTLMIFLVFIFALQLNTYAVIVSTDKQVDSGSGNVTVSVTSKQSLGAYTLKLVDTAGLTLVSAASDGQVSADNKTITNFSDKGITSLGTFTFKVPTVSKDTTYNVKFSITGMETPDLDPIADESNTAVIKVIAPVVKPESKPEETPSTPEQKPESKPEEKPTTPSTSSKSSDTSLKSLSITPFGKINKASSGIYDITVDNSLEKVTVKAVANSSKASVDGNKEYELEEGTNQIKIIVTAEDGSTETHKIKIRRKAAEVEQPITPPNVIEEEEKEDEKDEEVKEDETKELGLLNLVITGIQLNPSFAEDVYEYTAEFAEDIDTLEVIATANTEGAIVEVAGNTNLVIGENLITIMVKSEDGEATRIYQVTVTKNEPEVVAAVTDNTIDENNSLTNINENPELKNQIGKIVIVAVAAIILVILLAIIVIAYTKKKDNEYNNYDEDSEKKTNKKKEKLGKDAFVVAVDEDESYRELEKLSEIRNKKRGMGTKETLISSKEDRVLEENSVANKFKEEYSNEFLSNAEVIENANENSYKDNGDINPNDLNEIEVSVPVFDNKKGRGRRFK